MNYLDLVNRYLKKSGGMTWIPEEPYKIDLNGTTISLKEVAFRIENTPTLIHIKFSTPYPIFNTTFMLIPVEGSIFSLSVTEKEITAQTSKGDKKFKINTGLAGDGPGWSVTMEDIPKESKNG